MHILGQDERKGRYLSHNKRTEQGRHHVFYDVESLLVDKGNGVKEHVFRFAWACYWRRDTGKETWRFCRTPEELLDFIESWCKTKDRVHVWAHNAFYDFAVAGMPRILVERGWKKNQHYFAGGTGSWFLIVKRDSASLLFLDTMNYYQQSLAKLGALIGEHKMDVDPLTASEDDLIPYCKQDVLIIRKAMERFLTFIAVNDLGNVGKTLASTAMNVYRHKYMHRPIHIHKHEPSWRLEHGSYYGGRVELFHKGRVEGPLYYLDINSQYPSVMASTELPCELIGYEEGDLSLGGLEKLVDHYYCIADVSLITDVNRYPVRVTSDQCRDGAVVDADPLAVNDQTGLRVIYPVGSFRTCLSHVTLRAALLAGHVVQVHRVAVYRKAVLFDEFVKEFWYRRRQAQIEENVVDSYLYKTLLNSFYGKWGQKQSIVTATYDCDPHAWAVETAIVNGKSVTIERLLGKERWIAKGEKASYNAFPAISAGITDGGRDLLWTCWQEAGMENLVYSDTDSLVVTQAGFDRLQHRIGSGLGHLKLEHMMDYLIVHGAKDYESSVTVKHKGVSARAVYDPTRNVWIQDQWLRPHGSLRRGSVEGYVSRTVEKRLQRTITTKKALGGSSLAPFLVGGRTVKEVVTH